MTIKKNHHIIPKVYLKEFVDLSKPTNFPANTPFTPFIWKIDKLLESKPVSKSPEKSFGKNRFYKLDSDAEEYQLIEELLSKTETAYKKSLEKLKNKIPLTIPSPKNEIRE
jgi:hypothetical protein